MKRLFFIMLLVLVTSCVENRAVLNKLTELDLQMRSNPDSVLAEIRNIDHAQLNTRYLRAYHSLLHSKALDKCYIDVTSDSIISPAEYYFRRYGPYDQRMDMCYYMARISVNSGDDDAAMEWLAAAERYVPKISNQVEAGKVFSLKSKLYFDLYDFSSALSNDKIASEYYLSGGDISRYLISLNDISNDFLNLGDTDFSVQDSAGFYLDKIKPFWDKTSPAEKALYYKTRIHVDIAADTVNYKVANRTKNLCMSELKRTQYLIPWLDVAEVFLGVNKPDSALIALGKYAEFYSDLEKDQAYLLMLSKVYEQAGDYAQSLATYKRFVGACELYNIELLNSDTRFIEERYEAKFDKMRNRQRTIVMLLLGVIFIIACFWVIRKISRRLKDTSLKLSATEMRYRTLEDERDALLSIQKNNAMLDEKSREVVSKRLSLLNKVLISRLSSDPAISKEADDSIVSLLDDKETFISSTATVFSTSHPKFVSYLRGCNLTEWEIGYCCLFLMGMYSKDMDPYFSRHASNNLNNTIRKKLSIPQNGQKLKSFLTEKFEALEGQN